MLWGENARLARPANVPAQSPSRWVEWRPRALELSPTLLGQCLAALACALAVLVFVRLDTTIASLAVLLGIAVGVVASKRGVPLAVWCTVGLVAGGVLGRFS